MDAGGSRCIVCETLVTAGVLPQPKRNLKVKKKKKPLVSIHYNAQSQNKGTIYYVLSHLFQFR